MKIAGYQLDTVLQRDLKPVYLIAGDDQVLCQEALNAINIAAQKSGFLEKTKWQAGEDCDEALANLLFSQDLFQNKKFIVLHFTDKNPIGLQQTILEEISKHLDLNKIIVIRIKKIDDKIQKTAWFKLLDKIGVIVTIWPLNYEQQKHYIAKLAKQYHLTIDKESLTLLAESAEGNLLAAKNLLEKISLLDENMVAQPTVKELTDNHHLFSIFDLGDALIARNEKRMLNILANLKMLDVEPTLILWSLTREVRILIDCLSQIKDNQDLQTVFQRNRILTKKQELIRRHLKEHTLTLCTQWLKHAFYIDYKIKHYLMNDVWRELQIFCLRKA